MPAAAPAIHEGTFRADDVGLRYLVAGEGEGVVLIHGFSDCIEGTWLTACEGVPFLQALAREWQVLALDCRGHGRSDKPHGPVYGFEMIQDVTRLLDHRGITRAHLVGYSMGAAIAGAFALRYPERVRSVVLGGNAPLTPRRYQEDGWKPLMDQVADSLERGGGFGPLTAFLWPPGVPLPDPREIEAMEAAHLANQDRLALAYAARQWDELGINREDLPGNQAPTLALIGEQDPLIANVNELRGQLAHLEVIEVPGATHLDATQRPEFLRHIPEFLARRRGAAGG
jgi:pimeloyl-ACP methyl ester carboxylesterase